LYAVLAAAIWRFKSSGLRNSLNTNTVEEITRKAGNFFSLQYRRYLEAIQTYTLLLSSLFDEAERGDSFTTRAAPEVLSETVWFNDFQPT
jgi:hypothetical protein